MQTLIQDLRYGARMLLKQKGFSALAIMTLALGVGANTALFSFLNTLLIKPLAGVAEPESLVQIGRAHEGTGFDTLGWAETQDMAKQITSLSGIAVIRDGEFHFSAGEDSYKIRGWQVTGNYFDVLGVRATTGRLLNANDTATEGGSPIVVISHRLWRTRFGGDPNIIGRNLFLNGFLYSIVGVAAQDFTGTEIGAYGDVWLPITMWKQADPTLVKWKVDWFTKRDATWLSAVGRLKSGVTMAQAQSEFDVLAEQLRKAYPNEMKKVGFRLATGFGVNPERQKDLREMFRLPLVVAALVLLIACANVAGLLLVRMQARRKEIAVRLSLGATRWRVAGQLLTECLLLSLLGGIAGVALAVWLRDGLQAILPEEFSGLAADYALTLDWRVFGFALLTSAIAGLLFGLAPAWQTTRQDLTLALKDQRQSFERRGRFNLRGALVIVQIALSLILLIGAGLCLKALRNARATSTGFDTDRVLTAQFDLNRQNYSDERGAVFHQQILERVRALPGVESASLGLTIPLSGNNWSTRIWAEDVQGQFPKDRYAQISFNLVSHDYLTTMGMRINFGRSFTPQDEATARPVGVIGEALARKLWPNESPLGKRFKFGWNEKDYFIEVIGVAREARGSRLFGEQKPQIYLSRGMFYEGSSVLFVRTTGQPEALTQALSSVAQSLDKTLPLTDIKPLSAYFNDQITPQRLSAQLITGFGVLALLLAALGLYSVLAFIVAARTSEFGLRMALGARTADVLRLVIGQGLRLAIVGVMFGIGGAWFATRYIQSLLLGVSPLDATAFIGMSILLLIVALLACWVPARRATKVDPMVALRCE